MRMAITGASGFVGRQIVPLLQRRGAELLLVGRDTDRLRRAFPDIANCDYAGLRSAAAGFDRLLHLAVVNNSGNASAAEIERTNVDMPEELCRLAREIGIKRFVVASSTHALDEGNHSAYAVSKRRAAERVAQIDGIDRWILYLPAVIGTGEFAGKLAVLGHLPRVLYGVIWPVIRSLKATVHAERVVDSVMALEDLDGGFGQRLVADGQRANRTFSQIKRFMDIAFALVIILLLWWVMAAVWLAIKVQSPGPGIFRQRRVGRNEVEFTCYKFRTMYLSAPNVGTHQVPAASVTPLGHFLRRTKLDELPQVFNLLRNEMSLVGPRPCLPTQHDMVLERRAQGVFEIKPGITGLSQIRGIDMSAPVELAACDREYLKLQSLLLDIKIIVRTALGAGSGDKIVRDPSIPAPKP